MQLFDLLFPVFMIGFPGVMALCLRTKETKGQEETIRLERRLGIATGITITLAIAVWCVRSLPDWSDTPAVGNLMAWESIPSAFLAQAGFFVLWFRFAMPLIRVYRPGFDEVMEGQTSEANKPVRSASLTPRKPPPALHIKSTIWTLGLWIIGFAFFFYGWKTHGVPEGRSVFQHLVLCSLGLIAALSVALVIPLGHQTMFLSPEPLRAGCSLELEAAYRNKHTFQGRLILGSILVAISLILLLPISLAFHWHFTDSDWGLIGGSFGGIVGLTGGVAGMLMSVHRLKIRHIEQGELEQRG